MTAGAFVPLLKPSRYSAKPLIEDDLQEFGDLQGNGLLKNSHWMLAPSDGSLAERILNIFLGHKFRLRLWIMVNCIGRRAVDWRCCIRIKPILDAPAGDDGAYALLVTARLRNWVGDRSRKERPTIPEPPPRFVVCCLVVGLLIGAAITFFWMGLGAKN
jgi:hypothetical protein